MTNKQKQLLKLNEIMMVIANHIAENELSPDVDDLLTQIDEMVLYLQDLILEVED